MPKKESKELMVKAPVQVPVVTTDTKAMAKIKADMEKELKLAQGYLATVNSGSIENEEDYKEAAALGNTIKQRLAAAKSLQTVMTAPMDSLLKQIKGDFKPVIGAYQDAMDQLAPMVSTYLTKKDQEERDKAAATQKAIDDETEKQRLALLKKSEKVQAKDPVQSAALAQSATQLQAPKVDVGQLKTEDGKKIPESMKFEVKDWRKVPEDMLLLNEAAVRDAGQETLRAARNEYNAGKMTEEQFEEVATSTTPGIRYFYVKQARF